MKKNKKGLYEKSYNITQADGSIKRIRLSSTTREGLLAKCNKLEDKINSGEVVVNRSSTFNKWMQEWLEVYKKPKVDIAYLQEIEKILNRFFTPSIGHMSLDTINLSHIQRCLNDMEGYSDSYIHRAKVYITECFRKAEDLDIVRKSPCRGLESPKAKEKEDRRTLTDKETEYLLKAAKKHPWGAMFTLILACGLRPGEVMALEWQDINTKENTINIRQAIRSNTKELKSTKTKSGKRIVPIPLWWINEYLPLINKNSSNFVFSNGVGKPIGAQKFAQYWRSLIREMDIIAGAKTYRNKIVEHALSQDIVPYCLRHTYCTKLIEKQMPIKTVQYLMGHADIRITMDIYTHITKKMISESRKYID